MNRPGPRSKILDQLRMATSAQHAMLDETLSGGQFSEPATYARFLVMHGRVLPNIEHQLSQRQDFRTLPAWQERFRARDLDLDIAELGAQRLEILDYRLPEGPGHVAGVTYVLEGSRMGGLKIASELRKSHQSQLPTRFLRHGSRKGFWPSFQRWIESQHTDSSFVENAVNSAKAVFALYLEASRTTE